VRRLLGGLLLALAALPAAAQPPAPPVPPPAPRSPGSKVIDVRAAQAANAGNSFEALWGAYKKAVERNDADTAQKLMAEIRRLRVERNVPGLETLALAAVAEGQAKLAAGDRVGAEESFRTAVSLDPQLADTYFALASAQFKRGPLGFVPGASSVVSGILARLRTTEGRHQLNNLLTIAGIIGLFLLVTVYAIALVARHGKLLVHDLEERFGLGSGRPMAFGVATAILLAPAALFMGWGWLPFWCLAVLFIYCTNVEKVISGVLVMSALLAGPAMAGLEDRVRSRQNPIFRAGLQAVEGGPDTRAMSQVEQALQENPDDKDLVYLLGRLYKTGGRYDDAVGLYRDALDKDPKDAIALNNTGNIDFARGDYGAAIVRYRQALETGPPTDIAAILHYNLSLAQYQKFDYQPAQESRSQADRLGAELVRTYDERWKYEGGLSAPVDLGLSSEELAGKFAAIPTGPGRKNVAGSAPRAQGLNLGASLLNRATAIPIAFGLVVLVATRMRGRRGYTARCVKCGTPFCNRCHLGPAAGSLCSQCHHLFVVRDGVSGPARNQKLLEVQKEEEQRDRLFRMLSLVLPGSGHVYAQKTLFGISLVLVWAAVLGLVITAGRVVPLTEAPSSAAWPLGLGVAGLLLLVVYVVANRSRPDFEVAVLAASPRRGAAGAAQARRRAS
jgi:tetratricopeptide (TPR) repeat protein